jgi:hypothetical protein
MVETLPESWRQHYMTAAFPDTLVKTLILDPAAGVAEPAFKAAWSRNPGLQGLHPLARALAFLHCDPGKLTRSMVKAALGTCWLSHNSCMEIEDEHSIRTEHVRYSIGPCEFVAKGTMEYCTIVADEVRSTRLANIPGKLILNAVLAKSEVLIPWWRHGHRRSKNCSIEDSGDFLGSMEHRLVAIGGLPVKGPIIEVSCVYEVQCKNVAEDFLQPPDGHDGPERICWLHYLSKEQALQLGIPLRSVDTPQAEGIDELPVYPAWVDPEWAQKHGWIRVRRLEASYHKGDEIPESLTFFVGPDAEWSPPEPEPLDDDEDLEDEDDEGQENFPTGSTGERTASDEALQADPALLEWSVSTRGKSLPEDLQRLLVGLQALMQTRSAGR